MAAITPEEARAYFKRWALEQDVAPATLRRTTMDTKARQLESPMASRRVFGPQPDR